MCMQYVRIKVILYDDQNAFLYIQTVEQLNSRIIIRLYMCISYIFDSVTWVF